MSHAPLSPSASARWIPCPGSIREEARVPERPSGPAAIDGTHSHTLLEHCNKMGLMDPMMFVGETFEDHEGVFTVDVDRAARVNVAVQYVNRRIKEIGGNVSVRAEEKVNAGAWIDRDDMFGTTDIQLIGQGFLEVIDYKDGMTPVDPVENPQLVHYGVGSLYRLRHPDGTVPVTNVRLTIVQPKIKALGLDPISHWDVTAQGLLDHFHQVIAPAAAATDDPDAPLVPGEKQCKWCRAKGSCKALASTALKEAQIMFAQVEVSEQAATKQPNEMSDAELLQIIEAKALLLQMIEGAEEEAKRRLETGQKIQGLKLVRGRGSRQWAFDEIEMEGKLKRMGLPKQVIWQTKLISPAQVEKARWQKKVKGEDTTVCLTERQIKRMEKEFIETKPGKLQVALASDHREEVVTDAATMFADVKPAEPDIPDWMK